MRNSNCDQCPNEGECINEQFEYCEMRDPLPLRREKRKRSWFADLAFTQENLLADNSMPEVVLKR